MTAPVDKYEKVTCGGPQDERLLREVADHYGLRVEVPSLRGMDVDTFLYLVGAAHLIKAAVEDFLDRKAGGQVIDLRADQATARRDPGLEWGRLVILWPDGSAEVREVPTDRFSQVCSRVSGIVGSLTNRSPHDVRRAIEKVTSADSPPAFESSPPAEEDGDQP